MKENKAIRPLMIISAICVAAGMILSMQSSRTAYALTLLSRLQIGAGTAILVYLLVALFGGKLPEILRDLLLLVGVITTSFAMCTLIGGRTTLAGYIYFSDLEANNPVAISAMNMAIAGVAAFLVSLILVIVVGFMSAKKKVEE